MKYQYYTTLAYEQVWTYSDNSSAAAISFQNQLDALRAYPKNIDMMFLFNR